MNEVVDISSTLITDLMAGSKMIIHVLWYGLLPLLFKYFLGQ